MKSTKTMKLIKTTKSNKAIKSICIMAVVIGLGITGCTGRNSDVKTSNISEKSTVAGEKITLKDGNTSKITKAGNYTVSGTAKESQLLVDSDGDINLTLNNVNITNTKAATIYIKNAKSSTITLVGANTLTDGTKYTDEDINATIYSDSDLILTGDG
ncbi:MAG: carbohydrate-binding domain-containing protein, partial [Clostridioides sp.]|nr:carbohydrate-binding domain-containing protein [Clostridioides sp.]